MSSIFSNNSEAFASELLENLEAFASELLENLEGMFPRYYTEICLANFNFQPHIVCYSSLND